MNTTQGIPAAPFPANSIRIGDIITVHAFRIEEQKVTWSAPNHNTPGQWYLGLEDGSALTVDANRLVLLHH